jgi:hypothetical protein
MDILYKADIQTLYYGSKYNWLFLTAPLILHVATSGMAY